jgi:magnesium transporter
MRRTEMITIRVNGAAGLAAVKRPEKNSWIDVKDATREDIELLEREHGINAEHLADIMDIDEQARIEKEDEYTLVIVRVPARDGRLEAPYHTLPIGVLLFRDRIITVCQADCDVLEELRNGKVRGLDIRNKSAFVLHILGRAAIVFLRYLKDINRSTAAVEHELQRSVRNHELTQLLAFEKSLVFFTTSLRTNGILLEKLKVSRSMRIKEDEEDLLEDVETDIRQAIEMSSIYSDILSGMMDAYASVISNNQNLQIKRLTTISIVFMPLNVLAGVGGMSEFSAFTTGIPWWIAYSFFGLGLVVVGVLTASLLKVFGLVSNKRLRSSRPRRAAAIAVPATALVTAGARAK